MKRPASCDDYRGRGQRAFPQCSTCALKKGKLNFLALTFVACSLLSGSGAEADQTEIFTGPIVQRSDIAKDLREYLDSIAPAAVVLTLGPETSDARGDPVLELRNYTQLVLAEESVSANNEDNQTSSAVRVSVPSLTQNPPQMSQARTRVAEADNIFDMLREFLQNKNGTTPIEKPGAQPPPAIAPNAPTPEPPIIAANNVGSNVCLGCHLSQADTFGYTLMGRLQKQGKMQCETCHGPGSAHVRAVGCAACHGDGGITTRPGIPSLVGQDPQYLVAAMKAYISGQRKHAMMKALLSGRSDAEINNIAFYYARQAAARAQTPLVGNPSTGKAATATCAACHGEEGISVSPAFPSLAGQDSQYLADAIRAYKTGARNKIVACAACHGERGISKTPGTPSLVGLDPQYLVAAMRAYVAGQRKNAVMKALLSGVGETELNNIAIYYAQQTSSRAPTSSIGDVSAGKSASAACAGCHGAQGVSANPVWPSLAGQDAKYLADAIEAYKDGSRTDETMKGIAASLNQDTINNLASYYASLHPEQPSSAKGAPAKPAPVLSENRLVASLDQRAIDNVASYFASQTPAQPEIAKNVPARAVPASVSEAAPVGRRSIGGIISFRLDDPTYSTDEVNQVCLNCHEKGQRTLWRGSVHEVRDLLCANCHTIMRNVTPKFALAQLTEPDVCFQCHKKQRSDIWQSSHMPVREGKMTCSSCHNPHGSYSEALLKTATVNDTCYKCHAEKRGPFLWEHPPVRENCLNCHDPHGSINDALLKVSRPRLCQQCHTAADHPGNPGNPMAIYSIGASCSNCHVKIHGSNSPAGAEFVR